MSILLFEDEFVPQLYPVSLARPAFAITCGGYRLIDLFVESNETLFARVRSHLQSFVPHDFAPFIQTEDGNVGQHWWLNARLVPSVSVVREVKKIIAAGKPAAVISGGSVALAYLPTDKIDQGFARGENKSASKSSRVPSQTDLLAWVEREQLPLVKADLPLFDWPHDVLRQHLLIVADNLLHRIERGDYSEIASGVFAAEGAMLAELVVTDTRRGPIILDEFSSVGPYTFLRGPVYIGANAKVIEHAALKDGVVLGHTSKAGGEIEASILEPYSNKQHFGFLGHSHVGSWVNLGAGTTNSDLKNSYGPITMDYNGRKVATEMQFIGCFIGDYAKAAIHTGIFTGKVIGACSNLYGFVSSNVPSFVNYARSMNLLTEVPVEVAAKSQERMFARRKVEQRPIDAQLLHDLYDLTRDERAPFEPLSKEPIAL